jgi:hypothetical protein
MTPTPAMIRQAVANAADPIDHPFKGGYHNVGANVRLAGQRNPYGPLVYSDGAVGGRFGGHYLIARGAESDLSLWALALKLGLVSFGPADVRVDEVDAGWFWLFANPGGRTPAEQ